MSITINRPIILTETQIRKFESVTLVKSESGIMSAVVIFGIYNNTNDRISEKVINYTGTEYNAFWEAFNNGKFLYEELVKNEEDVTIPDEIEEEFLN